MSEKFSNPHYMLMPSLSCPASCAYCFGPHRGPAMDEALALRAASFVARSVATLGQKKVSVTLHGGEPLAAGHGPVAALLRALRAALGFHGVVISVQSNLWLLDEAFCELFSECDVSLGTSLDGPEDVTDSQRGPGYFGRTSAGIDLARRRGLPVSCIATFTRDSLARCEEVFDFLAGAGLSFSVHQAAPTLRGPSGLELGPEGYAELLGRLLSWQESHLSSCRVLSLEHYARAAILGSTELCTFRDCLGLFLVIGPDGKLYPCQRFCGEEAYSIGSIDDAYDPAAWLASPGGKALLERERATALDEAEGGCGGCEHFTRCKGGCAYNAFAAGTPRDPYCPAYRSAFSRIAGLAARDIASAENEVELAQRGLNASAHPLLWRGPSAALLAGAAHPRELLRTSRRVLAAVELARNADPDGSLDEPALRLVDLKACASHESAIASLEKLRSGLRSPKALNNLYLHATFDCQLSCTHCYARAGASGGEHLGSESVASLAREARTLGFRQAVLTGGEPLVAQDWRGAASALEPLRRSLAPLKLVLRTNFAAELSESDLALLARAFDQVVVSLDGDEAAHDLRRGPGSFRLTTRNLERYARLSASDPDSGELSIAAVLDPGEAAGPTGRWLSSYARGLGVKRLRFRPMLPLGRARDRELPVTSESLSGLSNPRQMLENGFYPVASCGIGQNLYIDPTGQAYSCYAWRENGSGMGDALASGLGAIASGAAFRRLRAVTVDTNRRCRGCEWRYLCGGACKAWGLESEGRRPDLDDAPAECLGLAEKARALYEEALGIVEEAGRTNRG
jgi:uncharacterized protein